VALGLYGFAACILLAGIRPIELPVAHDHRCGGIFEPPRLEVPSVHRVTAYCPCPICCGKWSDGITASGTLAKAGRTIAADRAMWNIGTCLEIPSVGKRIVEDTGSAIIGNRIDVYFNSHDEALQFGVKLLPVVGC